MTQNSWRRKQRRDFWNGGLLGHPIREAVGSTAEEEKNGDMVKLNANKRAKYLSARMRVFNKK